MVHMNLFPLDYRLDAARLQTRFTFPACLYSVPSLLLHHAYISYMHGLLTVGIDAYHSEPTI
jgi:hypothetical protein